MTGRIQLSFERLERRDLLTTVNGEGAMSEPPVAIACHAAHPVLGDANCDGLFDSSDLISMFQSNEFEDGIANNSQWPDGDFDGNGEFDSTDLVLAQKSDLYEVPPEEDESLLPQSTLPGDANQDGFFDSSDILQIMNRGQYEDQVEDNSVWQDGDFTSDLDVTSADLILAFRFGLYLD